MYRREEIAAIKNAWERFHRTGKIVPANGVVRKEIAESWLRSREYGVNASETGPKVLEPLEFRRVKERKRELLEAAEPYIRNLYEMILGSSSYICITDENGVVLSCFYDKEQVNMSAETFPLPGRILSEQSTGTNAIGTCLYLDKPFFVFGEEHYKLSSHPISCFSAPIHRNGQIIGLINVSAYSEESDIKVLALIIAMAGSIEREMQLREANQHILLNNTLLKTILNSMSEGALLMDDQNIVIQVNNNAYRILEMEEQQVIGHKIDQVIQVHSQWYEFLSERRKLEDQEIRYHKGGELVHLIASIFPCDNNADIIAHKVITFKKMKDVRKLINKMTSSSANYTFHSIIHKSEVMMNVIKLARRADTSDATVFLRGESGTGKEMFAQAIHNASSRSGYPFIAINCGALPRGLVESELFGYEGGAFTGSRKNGHLGKFELAEGGTIFLDEIGDMPLDLQATLLRVLQNKEVTRIGGKTSKKINVRIIAATNCDVEDKIRNRTFREDLYYRLNVFTIHIPPLRERPSDIEQLIYYLANKHCTNLKAEFQGFSPEALETLRSYSWPGNVRELENVIERTVNISPGQLIAIEDLPPQVLAAKGNGATPSCQSITLSPLAESEAALAALTDQSRSEYENLVKALTYARGNVQAAAELLHVRYRSIYRRIEKYNIDKKAFRKLPPISIK